MAAQSGDSVASKRDLLLASAVLWPLFLTLTSASADVGSRCDSQDRRVLVQEKPSSGMHQKEGKKGMELQKERLKEAATISSRSLVLKTRLEQ